MSGCVSVFAQDLRLHTENPTAHIYSIYTLHPKIYMPSQQNKFLI